MVASPAALYAMARLEFSFTFASRVDLTYLTAPMALSSHPGNSLYAISPWNLRSCRSMSKKLLSISLMMPKGA